MISILVLFLLGVVTSRHISYYDNEPDVRPIITKSQERRICAELCMAGLGGEPCGDDCLDVIPHGLPTESQSQSQSGGGGGGGHTSNCTHCPRQDACPLLCANRLGYPLCNCSYTQETTPFFRVDYSKICSFFCEVYHYQIFGCDSCSTYKNMTNDDESIVGVNEQVFSTRVDWNAWCVEMCQQGDGGAACYCDLLPMGLKFK